MIIATFIFSLLNLIGLIIAAIIYFKERFCIVSIEQWNELATVYNKVITEGLVDDNGEIVSQELPGGVGFFKEALNEEYYEEEEEE